MEITCTLSIYNCLHGKYTAFTGLWLLGSCDNVGLATHSALCVCVMNMCIVKHGKQCQRQSDTSDLATSRNSPAL